MAVPDLSLVKFNADISAFAKLLSLNLAMVVKKLTLDLFSSIVLRTPVDTGRARAGWAVSIGSPIVATPAEGSYPAAPGAPDVSAVDGTQIVYILNNVEYVPFLEEGSSKQAPAGMVRLAIAEAELKISAILAANP